MAGKITGLAWTTLSVDDSAGVVRAIINDINDFQFATPYGLTDVTGVDKSAIERLQLLADFSIGLNGTVNVDANASHDVFKILTGVRTVTITHAAKSLPNECLFSDYSWKRDGSGSLGWSAAGVLANGVVPLWS